MKREDYPSQIDLLERFFNLFKKITIFSGKRYIDVILTMFLIIVSAFMYLAFLWGKAQLDFIQKELETHSQELPKNIIVSSTSDNKRINEILYDLLIDTKADRSYIFQFHNGKKGLSGIEFLFMTNTHEQVMPGISSEISTLQSVPISIGTEMLGELVNGDGSKCWEVSKIKDTATRGILERQADKYLCFELIHDTYDNPIGFVGIDYVNRPFIGDTAMPNLKLNTAKIEELLQVLEKSH